MAERPVELGRTELEAALLDLGRHIDYPATPALAASIRRRIALAPAARKRQLFFALLPQRVVALVTILLIAFAVATLALSPETRSAIADRLGLRGVQITQQVPAAPTLMVPVPSASAATPLGARLNLGRHFTLDEARTLVSFQIQVPAALGRPDDVYLQENTPPGGQVALLYAPHPGLPQASTTGVAVLLTEVQASFETGGPILKGLPPGTRLEEVSVNGARGYWIDGDPHVFFFKDAQGHIQTESTRLAANVLLWESGALTLRLESALDRDAALAIANSLHP